MNGPHTRVTLLVGAGLVNQAFLPTSVELVANVKRALTEAGVNAELSAAERALANIHLSTFRFLNGGIRFQRGVLDDDPDDPVNIEQIAVAALELQDRLKNPLAPYTFGWHPRIVELEARNDKLLATFLDFI